MGGDRLEIMNVDNRILMKKLFSQNLINAKKSRIMTSKPKLDLVDFSRVVRAVGKPGIWWLLLLLFPEA